MATRDRIKRYKTTGGAAGLVQVEVLVPLDDRQKIVDLAAHLRADYRRRPVEADELDRLFDEAVTR